MKIIGLIANLTKDPSGIKTRRIVEIARSLDMRVQVIPGVHDIIKVGEPTPEQQLYSLSDIIVSLGGDGTLLQAACQAALWDKPIMGINTGNLGFLTDGDFSQAPKALEALKEGEYYIERRMMLEGTIVRGEKSCSPFLAFNDIGIMKALVSRIIQLKASVNSHEINSYSGDGLLVSSPTGSTAYSLSAGGPIVDPSLECLLLTPICPHSLNARSIIINCNDIIEIEIMCPDRDIALTADGQAVATLIGGDRILVKKADTYVQLLRTKKQNFFDLIHEKIII
ncbi:MAG: NAD(+)/NADH kinase [Caldicoprobacterales bacterium]|nr:NAD(+)/NADH kinase [Clostridiales bacterium]